MNQKALKYYGLNYRERNQAKKWQAVKVMLLEAFGCFVLGSLAGAFLYLAYIGVL